MASIDVVWEDDAGKIWAEIGNAAYHVAYAERATVNAPGHTPVSVWRIIESIKDSTEIISLFESEVTDARNNDAADGDGATN